MAGALEGEARFSRTLHAEAGMGFGRVGLPTLGSRAEVVCNEQGTRALVMEGEFYDDGALRAELAGGEQLGGLSQAALLLRLYERQGEAAIERLNGAFCGAIWDRPARQLTLFNDRLGLFPLYYARVGGELVFASGVRALLADPALPRRVDLAALNQFLVYDHMLDDRTRLESVKLLPQGSILRFCDRQLTIRRYWTPQYPDVYEPRPEAAYVEGLAERLRQAVARQGPGAGAAAVLLSGGLDSRLLLGLLVERGAIVEALTFGIAGCDDARVAAEVAAATRTRYRFFELKPEWLRELGAEAVRITDGQGNVVNLHALATLEEEARHAQVLYKGFMGDALLGFALKRQMWADYTPDAAVAVHRVVHGEQGVLNYGREQLQQLLTDQARAELDEAVYGAYREGMQRAGVSQLASQRLYFDLTQRVPRMTLNGVEVARTRAVVRLPFCDNDLLDFALTVPPGFLLDRYLPRTVLVRHFTRLAQIPVAGTGRPLRFCARDLAVQARELAAWHLGRIGLGWIAERPKRPYKDYNRWFRGPLRGWVEDLLLDRVALDRGYFRPRYVRQLLAEQAGGADHAVRIGALLTSELWHRQFLD